MAERTCIICRSKADKERLVRVVATGAGLSVDRRQSLPGRGAYIHASSTCVSRLAQVGRWERALRLPERTLDARLVAKLAEELMSEVAGSVGAGPSAETPAAKGPGKGKLRL